VRGSRFRLYPFKLLNFLASSQDNLNEFFQQVQRLHLKCLNRRSQRPSYTWAGYRELLRRFTLERPRITTASGSC